MSGKKIAIIGGDTRLSYMVPLLARKGFAAVCFGTETIPEKSGISYCIAGSVEEALDHAEGIVCGIPFARGDKVYFPDSMPELSIARFCEALPEGCRLFGGVLPESVKKACMEKQTLYFDFMEDEPLAVFNAVATAEGTILTALQEQPTNLHGSACLVLGYGNCGRVLSDKLKGLSADVTVCVRKAGSLACAAAAGMGTLPFDRLSEKISKYEYIFNTVPAPVLPEKVLTKVSKTSLIVDIATGGGVDYRAAKRLGIRAMLVPGLPGKYAPKTSAVGMAEFVIKKME